MLRFHPLRVSEIRPDAEDAIAISLDAPAEVRAEYRGLPGQHVVLRTQINGVEARRTYSLTSVPGDWPLRIAVRVYKNGAMSRHLADGVRVGDQIDVLPANGSLTPRFSDRRTYVGFASGCGITPILAVARAVLAADTRNRFILFYGNSSVSRTMCLEEILALKDLYLDRLALHFVMSREPQEVDLYNGRLDAERVKKAARALFDPTRAAEFFVCGPGHMIEDVSAALRDCGAESERIHGEHFVVESEVASSPAADHRAAAPVAGATGATTSVEAASADAAKVTLIMDGRRRSFTMRMNADTVLDAATKAGIELPFSCRAGVCSTCRTKVLRGAVEMQQNYALEEWELEEGYVLACQSRVKTPELELDYDEK
jgi:ring-1,2-phenylacetyl-CoA epoxidase subunit PaaE